MKSIVTPGEVISDKPEHIVSGAYLKDGKTFSEYLGVLYSTPQGIQVVPLQGKYSPKIEDTIYGVVLVEDNFGYIVDIKSYRYPYVSKRSLDRMTFTVGDIIFAKVISVNEVKDVGLEVISKQTGGVLLEISPKKVPRVIGKHRSMLSVIEKYSQCQIFIGANGFMYVREGKPEVVSKALELIEKYSPVDNLTDKIDEYLSKAKY